MEVKVIQSKEVLVYSAPVNESTKKWGVYAIPRLWRDITGKLVVRLNGEIDCGAADNMQAAENLYFESEDEGNTWRFVRDGEQKYDINILNGIGPAYTQVGEYTIAFREKKGVAPIKNIQAQKQFMMPNEAELVKAYKYGDLSGESKGFELLRYRDGQEEPEILPVEIDFPEREVLVITSGRDGNAYYDVEERLKQMIWKQPYFSSVTVLADGKLGAITCGQNPDVTDHYCGIAYLIVSEDGGVTWKKRSTVAESTDLPYGYTGDGHENSLTKTPEGVLLCAMRMDMSINPNVATPICDTMVAISHDNGYTWSEPTAVADSSVTPQVVSLENGITVLIYGRPGVHLKYSKDNGKTWSSSYSIIGETLEECRKKGIKDADSKYFDMISYSNSFVEVLDSNSILVLYNHMKYDEGDGVLHKATFVKKITFEK